MQTRCDDVRAACDEALLNRVSSRIEMARLLRSMALKDVAQLAGCSVSFLSRIESGNSLPSIPSLVRITAALEMSMAWVMDDDDGFLPNLHPIGVRPAPADVEPGNSRSVGNLPRSRSIAITTLAVKGGAKTGRLTQHSGASTFVVTRGVLRIHRGDASVCAVAGDSFHLRAPEIYDLSNGSVADLAVTVFSQPSASRAPQRMAA